MIRWIAGGVKRVEIVRGVYGWEYEVRRSFKIYSNIKYKICCTLDKNVYFFQYEWLMM